MGVYSTVAIVTSVQVGVVRRRRPGGTGGATASGWIASRCVLADLCRPVLKGDKVSDTSLQAGRFSFVARLDRFGDRPLGAIQSILGGAQQVSRFDQSEGFRSGLGNGFSVTFYLRK